MLVDWVFIRNENTFSSTISPEKYPERKMKRKCGDFQAFDQLESWNFVS